MSKYTFFIATEPYKFEATDSMIKMGEALINKGHNIRGVFFFGTAVYSLKKEITVGGSIRNVPGKLEEFCEKHTIPMAACSTWVSITGVKEAEFIRNASEEGLGDFSNWVMDSDKVILFGPGG